MTTTATTSGKPTTRVDRSKWVRFALLVMAGGTIYKLANLKDAFYVPMQEAMSLSHTEIGTLLSVNSMVATALFIVGGYLADRFSTRILIPLGLVGTGTLGLFLSTFPGFGTLLLLFALLAVCSDCLVWPALLKSIRQLGGPKEQGRLFGLLEGGRGVVDTAVAFSALGIFVLLGSGPADSVPPLPSTPSLTSPSACCCSCCSATRRASRRASFPRRRSRRPASARSGARRSCRSCGG